MIKNEKLKSETYQEMSKDDILKCCVYEEHHRIMHKLEFCLRQELEAGNDVFAEDSNFLFYVNQYIALHSKFPEITFLSYLVPDEYPDYPPELMVEFMNEAKCEYDRYKEKEWE